MDQLEQYYDDIKNGKITPTIRTLRCGCQGLLGWSACECDILRMVGIEESIGSKDCPHCPAQGKRDERHERMLKEIVEKDIINLSSSAIFPSYNAS